MMELDKLVVKLVMDTRDFFGKMGKTELRILKAGKKIEALGNRMMMKLTLPLTIFAATAATSFGQFDQAMTQSIAIMKGVTPEIRREMEKTAFTLSDKGVKSSTELAKSYYFLASAGLTVQQSIKALPVVTSFATAGMFDMAKATDLLTDAQSALGLTVSNTEQNMKNMTRLGDLLVGANTIANASVEQFATSLTSKAGAAMRLYGVEVEQGMAVLAAYADQGVKAELAGERLAILLRELQRTAVNSKDAWKAFGVSVFDSAGKMLKPVEIIRQLENRLLHLSDEQRIAAFQMLGFNFRSIEAASSLLGLSSKMDQYYGKLKKMQGTMKDVEEKQMKSFANQMKMIFNQLKNTAILIGSDLAPTIKTLGQMIGYVNSALRSMPEGLRKTLVVMLLLTAATGPLVTGLGKSMVLFAQTYRFLPKIAAGMRMVATSSLFLKASLIGLAVGGMILLWRWVYKSSGAIRELDAAMKQLQKTNTRFNDRYDKRFQGIMEKAMTMGGAEKQQYLLGQIATMEKELQGVGNQVEWAKKGFDELNTSFRRSTGNKMLKAQKQLLDDTRDRYEKMKGQVEELKKELGRPSPQGITPTGQGLPDLERHQKMLDEQKKRQEYMKKINEQVGGIVEQNLTPMERMKMKQAELNRLYQMGAFKNREIFYHRAMAAAKEEAYRDQIQKTMELRRSMEMKVKGIVESNLTPLERLRQKQAELNHLRKVGAFRGQEQFYHRAMISAFKEFEEEKKRLEDPVKVKFEVEGFEALLMGTAEARARIEQYKASLNKTRPTIPRRPVTGGGAPVGPRPVSQSRPTDQLSQDQLNTMRDIEQHLASLTQGSETTTLVPVSLGEG